MTTITRKELTSLDMVGSNEVKYRTVVVDGKVMTWAGFGWVTDREATPEDKQKYPTVED